MVKLHNLLERQILKSVGNNSAILKEWDAFVQIVNETYHDFDNDRRLIERSLELTSQEHLAYNAQMQKVREIAIGIDSKNSFKDIFSFVVESAREIDGIGFVLVQTLDKSGEYIVTPYYSNIGNDDDLKLMDKVGVPLASVLGMIPTSGKLKFPLVKMKVAQDYLRNPRVIVKDKLSELLDGVWPKTLCDTLQNTFKYQRFVITPLLVNGKSWGNLLFFLKSHVSPIILETITAHCSLGIKNVLSMDSLKIQNTELAKSERKYSLIANSTADFIGIMTMKGIFKYISPSHKQLGYEENDLVGKSGVGFLHPDDKPKFLSLLAQFSNRKLEETLAQGNRGFSQIITFRVRDKQDNWRYIESNASLIPSEDNQSHNLLLVSRDLTEKKRAEEVLKESEERYHSIFDSANDIILLIDHKGNVLNVNKKIADIAGYDPSDLVGHNILSLTNILPPRSIATIAFKFGKRMMGLDVPTYEVEMIKKNGAVAYVEINARPVKNGNKVVGDLAILRDISERRESERVLREQKELIDRILSTTPNAVMVVGDDLKVVMANRAFYQTSEKQEEEVVAKPISEVLPVEAVSRAVCQIRSGKTTNMTCEFRHTLNHHDRMFVANAIRMGQDEILLILDDVTEERERQERLYLTDRLASVGEMAAGIAHELNNPLTGVIGLSQILLDEEMPEAAKQDLKTIYSEAQRAAAVVRNLLTFARKHGVTRQPVQINEIIAEVLKLRAYEHRVNNIQVTTHLDDELPQVTVDRFQMQQVFLNIVLNAEQAMIEARKEGRLTITTERVNGSVKIAFSDNGPGITPENMRKLFSPFFTTKEVGKGTGLGLSICYGIVTAHHGRISAQSEVGQGAIFRVELPLISQSGGESYDSI
jgi:PAS domain S-box-containing protein